MLHQNKTIVIANTSMNKFTPTQYRHIFTAVRSYQKENMHDYTLYQELSPILDKLYSLAYPTAKVYRSSD